MNKKTKSTITSMLIGIIAVALLGAFDQFTKYLAIIKLKGQAPFVLIPGVFELRYLENRGAAFGILENQRLYFIIITPIILLVIGFIYSRIPNTKRYVFLKIVCILFCAGGIGNLIDRFRFHYVVDFFYFSLINFPIFNVADCYVVISAIALIVLILFYYKEEEMEIFSLRKKKAVEAKEEEQEYNKHE